ncbi:HTH_Tnp_Tc3_2 domain-containing protein [Trichonephila clavipes]|nr:HTH_Tnp_Tc3_2 domain-containing protein [Trichonephila clavipes]
MDSLWTFCCAEYDVHSGVMHTPATPAPRRAQDSRGSKALAMPIAIRAHYKQLSEFERDRIIGLKEVGWENCRIACHMSRSNAAIRRCWQEWVDSGRVQCHDGSGRSKATADREDKLTVRSAVTVLESSLSIIRCATHTSVHHDHSQRFDSVKFTLVPTATQPATHACALVKPDYSGA